MDLARSLQPLAYVLAPVLICQGRGLRRRIPRLPEAADPAGTAAGAPPAVQLAVVGDSTAAGVGAACHQDALAGMLGAAIARRTGLAGCGPQRRHLKDGARPGAEPGRGSWRPDIVVMLIGVNDLKNMRRLRDWDHDVPALLAAIDETAGQVPVIVCGMAPVSRFPALPQPMRAVMALRARAMDHTLRRVAAGRHVPVDPQMIGDGFFAEDGFHPSSHGYRAWADVLAGPVALAVASP